MQAKGKEKHKGNHKLQEKKKVPESHPLHKKYTKIGHSFKHVTQDKSIYDSETQGALQNGQEGAPNKGLDEFQSLTCTEENRNTQLFGRIELYIVIIGVSVLLAFRFHRSTLHEAGKKRPQVFK